MAYLQTPETVEEIKKYVHSQFSTNIVPSLMDYVRIPNLSPFFDKQWQENGLLNKVFYHL